jgi:hypothetical protein
MRSLAGWQRAGLGLALLAALSLGIARAWAVPPGYNVDEWARIPQAIRLAGCWRQTAAWLARSPGAASAAPCWHAGHFNGNPAYYFVLSIPIAFIPNANLDAQYHAARLVTVGLGLATIWLAWLTCGELFGGRQRPSHLGRVAVGIAAAAALNQSFGDIVSGVNSDASAALALGFLIYGMARFESRHDSLRARLWNGLLVALAAASAWWLWAISARWLAVPVFIWWVLSQFGPKIRLGTIALALAGLAAALAIPGWMVEWNSPQYWFNAGPTEILGATRRVEADSPLGPHALLAQTGHGRQTSDEVQYLQRKVASRLAGQTITFGAWLKGPPGQIVQGPIWDDGGQRVGPEVTATGDWQFVAATVTVSAGGGPAAIFLAPPASGAPLLFDGLVVAQGSYPTGEPPHFANESGHSGEWGGHPFTNLLLNPSAEATWPTLRTEGMPRDFGAYNGRIRSLLAWRLTLPAYPIVASWMFSGFWSEFSGLYPGLSRAGLLLPGLYLLVGVAGAVMLAWRPKGQPELRWAVRFFAPIAIIIWGVVILRSDIWPNLPELLSFVGARYAVTATVPSMALLVMGSLYWLPERWHGRALAVLALALWLISLHVLLRTQIPFYQCLPGASLLGSCLPGG